MARMRQMTVAVLVAGGHMPSDAETAVEHVWSAPDPRSLAHPLTDLRSLLAGLRASGRRIAIATSDDRIPTQRTLELLGVADLVDATVCADDGLPVKPAPDMVLHVCSILGVDPGRTAIVGDSLADLRMARAAGAGRVIGVLTGVGRRDDLEPLADLVIGSVEQLRIAKVEGSPWRVPAAGPRARIGETDGSPRPTASACRWMASVVAFDPAGRCADRALAIDRMASMSRRADVARRVAPHGLHVCHVS